MGKSSSKKAQVPRSASTKKAQVPRVDGPEKRGRPRLTEAEKAGRLQESERKKSGNKRRKTPKSRATPLRAATPRAPDTPTMASVSPSLSTVSLNKWEPPTFFCINENRTFDEAEMQKFWPQSWVEALNLYGAYYFWNITALALLAYYIPLHPLATVPIMFFTLLLESYMFVYGHIKLHLAFCEVPYEEMTSMCAIGFIHHYVNPFSVCKEWLPGRLYYYEGVMNMLGGFRQIQHNPLYIVVVPLLYGYFVYQQDLLSGLLLMAGSHLFAPIGYWWMLICSWIGMISGSMECALICHGFMLFWVNTNAMAHEWFHCSNQATKRKHFWFFSRWWMAFLEAISIISTPQHKLHHVHRIKDMNTVVEWVDMKGLNYFERYGRNMWEHYVSTYFVPGQRQMMAAHDWESAKSLYFGAPLWTLAIFIIFMRPSFTITANTETWNVNFHSILPYYADYIDFEVLEAHGNQLWAQGVIMAEWGAHLSLEVAQIFKNHIGTVSLEVAQIFKNHTGTVWAPIEANL